MVFLGHFLQQHCYPGVIFFQTGPLNRGCMDTGHMKLNRIGRRRLSSLKIGTNSVCNIDYKMQQGLKNHC